MNETVSGNQMLKGRHVLVTGIANRWSIAWAVAEAVLREGGAITLTYQGETQLGNIRKILADIPGGDRVLVEPLDVCDEEQLKSLCSTLEQSGIFLDGVVHSIAFA
ncbi:short-chain dehydrogenase/reductase SDR, partial [mine drainage metagenome]